jgi:type IV pilus assembly protein PilY1
MVASGYNNADGVGRLYVINANTGTLIRTISTGVGTAANPSGLSKLAARVPTSNTDNTVFQVYGGDLLGNVWRFDVNNDIGTPGYDAQLLINLQDPSGNPQPITAKPTVASVGGNPLVIVGTGRYLGVTDLSTTTINSVYGIQDKLTTTTLTTPRGTGNKFVHQVMTDTTCPTDAATAGLCTTGQTVRTSTNYTVDWTVNDGWHVDLVLAGERMVTDPTLGLGTLAFTTIKPQSSTTGTVTSCTTSDTSVSATSYLYYLNYLTGGPVDGSKGLVGNLLCTCVATRPSVVRLPDGTVEAIIRTSGSGNSTGTDMGSTSRQDLIVDQGGGALRRLSWRDLNGM